MPPLAGLARARLRSRKGAALLIAVPVAAATLIVLIAGAVLVVARDAGLRDAIRAAGPGAAARVQITRPGATAAESEALFREAERRFPADGFAGPPGRGAVLSAQTVGGHDYALAGVEGLARSARLRTGRQPAACRRAPCEVLAIGGARVPGTLRVRGVEVRVVGTASLDPARLGPIPPPQPALAAGATFLVTEGTAFLALPALRRVPRELVLAATLDPDRVHPWNVDEVVRGLDRGAAATIGDVEGSRIVTPARLLTAEAQRGRAASRLALLVAVLAGTLLAAFLALAAAQRSRDVTQELERLTDAGASRRQRLLFVLVESALLAAPGVAVAVVLAAAATTALAAAAGSPVPGALGSSLLSPGALTAAAGTFAVATAVLSAAAVSGEDSPARAGFEVAGSVLLALIAWIALTRAPIGPEELAGGMPDPVLVLLPPLIAVAAGLIAFRLLPRLLTAVARRTRDLPRRLALLSAVRSRGRTAAAVACLALSLGCTLFALGHRGTLREAQEAAAAFEVGVDARVDALPGGLDPLALPDGVDQGLALRATARTAARGDGIALLGAPPGLLPGLERLDGGGVRRFVGGALRVGDRGLRLRYRISGSALAVSLAFQRRDGTFERMLLGTELRPGRGEWRAPVPRSLRGARLFAVEVTLPLGAGAVGDRGALALQPLQVSGRDGRRALPFEAWQPAGEGAVNGLPGGGAEFRFSLITQARYLAMRAAQPTVREPVPAVVSPDLLAQQAGGGRLPLRINGGDRIDLRIVGVRRSFPTIAARSFAVVDTGRLFAVANAKFPGSAAPREAWLRYPAELERSVVSRLGDAPGSPRVRTRAQALAARRADAVSRGVLAVLLAAAVTGGLVSLAGLLVALGAAARDERGELAELEALGVGPAALRRQLRAGALLLAACGLAAGVCAGAVLTRAYTALVQVGADGRAPRPALPAALPWAELAAGCLAFAVAAVIVILVRGRGALRGPEVGRLRG